MGCSALDPARGLNAPRLREPGRENLTRSERSPDSHDLLHQVDHKEAIHTKIGYARNISPRPGGHYEQIKALFAAGAGKIYAEPERGNPTGRDALREMLGAVGEGDTVVSTGLPVLAGDLDELGRVAARLDAKGAGLAALSEGIGADTERGRMLSAVLRSMLELPRDQSEARSAYRSELERALPKQAPPEAAPPEQPAPGGTPPKQPQPESEIEPEPGRAQAKKKHRRGKRGKKKKS